jgi:D-alanyl-D-alanine carboxypeptidase/D-alanyl-D-alanine carboxypeptidase (penicillin-binding protein 5/6)
VSFLKNKYIFKINLIFSVFVIFPAKIKTLEISARSAVIICADSGDVIWERDKDAPGSMASTTKIMSALLTLEEAAARGNRDLEITPEMVEVEGSSMGLEVGDVIDLESLAKGMLLPSGNDSANAAAVSVSGNIENFLKIMNARAKQLGMKNTNFCTPSGLDFSDHHSTAYDMAILGAYAMENEQFAEIVRKNYDTVKFKNSNKKITLKNHNKLLKLYKYCIGVKTGFTKRAGRCLVSCAEKDGVRLVAVTLNDPDDWQDHISLYNYGFANITSRVFDEREFRANLTVNNGEVDELSVIGSTWFSRTFRSGKESEVKRQIELPESIKAPVYEGQVVGKAIYTLEGKKIGENTLTSEKTINAKVHKNIFQKIKEFILKIFRIRQ